MTTKFYFLLLAFVPAIALSQSSPGGVGTSLNIWMKAGTGVTGTTSVTQWTDQSSNGYQFTQATTTKQPALIAAANNYNPGIQFVGRGATSRYLSRAGAALYNINGAHNVFMAIRSGATDGVVFSSLVATTGKLYHSYGDFQNNYSASNLVNGSTTIANDSLYLIRFVSNASAFCSNFINTTALDADSHGTIDDPITSTNIGGSANGGHGGDGAIISEMVVYDADMSAGNKRQVESYLAVKYAITLADGIYNSSAGTVIWNASGAGSTYNNRVIGIGRDDNSGLLQKQSHTSSDTTRIYLSTLQTTNAANGGTFGSDGSFVITGNNAGQMFSTGSTEYPTGQGIYSRLDREWKITNTNFSGTFSMDFTPKYTNVTASDLRILIDGDGDFSNAAVYNPTITFNSGVITVSGINNTMIPANSTQYLTLVSLSATTPLPVSLSAFTAQPKGTAVELNWTTATEQNNAWFVIERSANGMQWQQIGKVPGAGNSSQPLNYSYTDAQPLEGTTYYRLKQTDVDGTYEYSPIEEVRMQAGAASLRIYPNPVSNEVVIEGKASTQTLKAFDALGKEVTHKLHIIHRTENKTVISMADMRNGLYIFRMNNQAYKVMKK